MSDLEPIDSARMKAPRIPELKMKRALLISVVDDDASLRESVQGLLESLGYAAATFPSAESFLISKVRAETDCLILDVRMPGMSGPALQSELLARNQSLPIIFITAHGDEDVVSRVMTDGAVECLFKPFSGVALLKTIDRALRS
jgi:FixJ family two-component response regulator